MKPSYFKLTSIITDAQLIRAINTPKNYIRIDTGFSCNHIASKNTFTNNYVDDETSLFIDLACDQTGLHYACKNLYGSIYSQWGFYCYHYADFGDFLKTCYSISEHQFSTLKRWIEA